MRRFAWVIVGCAATACGGKSLPSSDDGGGGASGDAGGVDAGVDSGGGGALRWYLTCGDPVCAAPLDAGSVDAGPTCPAIGSACATRGETCGTRNPNVHCGAIEVCDDHDPAVQCPVSTRKHKWGVSYLDDAALASLHDEALAVRLASYRYTGDVSDDPAAPHLGFVIEDQPRSPSVDRLHDRVDLYGYLSMTLAAVQVQEREIAGLRREVEEMRRTCGGRR